ncbi:alpha-macroglobulin-like protein [Euroglyphus maynei]|uniref:Alpha-macroglobulin-like protein n=1 Tax=Euroglyphus maynei TaxID=6958 RepID=A0A1Y3AQ67_EURMA|nr:alpha-macroglobulin-like protein [Euroglyphus maynei]
MPKESITDSLANFLTLQQKDGAFDNTQNTIVALEALTSYYSAIESYGKNHYNLMSNISFNYRPKRSIKFTEENIDLLHIIDVEKNIDNVDIVTLGDGLGKIELLTTYNILGPNDKCHFELNILSSEDQEYSHYSDIFTDTSKLIQEQGISYNDNYKICDDNYNHGIRKRSIWIHMRNRLLQQNTTIPTSSQSINQKQMNNKENWNCSNSFDPPSDLGMENPAIRIINIRFRRLNDDEKGMVILEVGLISGFKAISSDLDRLKKKKIVLQCNIVDSKIEFYLKDVPYAKRECLSFRIYQENVVTETQAALVNIYDYYRPGSSCSQSYNDINHDQKIHSCNETCQCKIKKICPSKLDTGLRISFYENDEKTFRNYRKMICKDISFIVEGTIKKKEFKSTHRKYLIHLNVSKVIAIGQTWQFYLDKICKLYRTDDKTVILIGKDDDNIHDGIRLIDGQTIIYERINHDELWLSDLNRMIENDPCQK